MLGPVEKTTNYEMFSIIKENRVIDEKHLNLLMRAIQKEDLTAIRPILVNPDYSVVDGQHRLEACKRLELPVYYQKSNEFLPVDLLGKINRNQKNWTINDYIKYYAQLGYEHYIAIIKEAEHYDTTPAVICAASSGNRYHDIYTGTMTYGPGRQSSTRVVLDLFFLIRPLIKDRLNELALVKGIKTFLRHPNANALLLAQKINDYPAMVKWQRSAYEYIVMLTDIHNFKRPHNRVAFLGTRPVSTVSKKGEEEEE